jgi:peptidoglycan/LPS O-acetylase OafA/YrhL
MVLAGAFIEGGLPLRVLGNRVLVYLGKRSYAIYLWHLPVGQWFDHFNTLEQLIIAGAVTLLAAELSHRVVERPALSLKRRFAWRAAPRPETAPDQPPVATAEPAPSRSAA